MINWGIILLKLHTFFLKNVRFQKIFFFFKCSKSGKKTEWKLSKKVSIFSMYYFFCIKTKGKMWKLCNDFTGPAHLRLNLAACGPWPKMSLTPLTYVHSLSHWRSFRANGSVWEVSVPHSAPLLCRHSVCSYLARYIQAGIVNNGREQTTTTEM